jgi:paraquat-inducible protein B
MSEATPPEVPTAVDRKPGPRSLQLIWLVPVVAAIIGGWLALKAVRDRGPTVTIQFASGEGLEAGKTRIKHKAVDVGIVRSVGLTQDHKAVIVRAELDRSVADGFLAEDTRFWVVRPRIAGGQVSGLGTLLAGVYIGSDPGKSAQEKRDFVGLETPPPVTSDQVGRTFTLLADDLGSLDIGSPVLYRGVTAGRVVAAEIPPDGKSVRVSVFVQSPYDKFVNHETRFWNASGVDVSIDAEGVKVQSQSLISVLLGGIAFETPAVAGAAPLAGTDSTFRLWNNQADAMRPRETVVEIYRLVFDHSVRGLAVGSTVDFRGLVVGEVRSINLRHDPEKVSFTAEVEIYLWPGAPARERQGAGRQAHAALRRARLPRAAAQRQPAHGAALRRARLLPQGAARHVRCAQDPARDPDHPRQPRRAAGVDRQHREDAREGALRPARRRRAARAGNARHDAEARRCADAAALHGGRPELRTTLDQARKTLAAAQQTLSSDSPMQGDLRETLQEVTKAAETVRALADYLERHPESLIRGKRGGEK